MKAILALQSSTYNNGYETGVYIIASDGRNCRSANPEKVLTWLALLQSEEYFIITWDLIEFLSPIFKLLPAEVVEALNSGERAKWPPFRLFLSIYKGKFFGVNFKYRTQIKGNFYNEDTYDINIYELKTFFPDVSRAVPYNEAADMGISLLKALDDMGMKPSKLTSPAAIYEESILRRIPIPTILTMPENALPMMEWCANYIKEWRTVYQIGIWPSGSSWDYDRSSAYPSEIALLPNISKAEFIHTDGSIPAGPPSLQWGILRGMVTINAEVSPVIYQDGTARKGGYPCLLPAEEWYCIKRHGIGDFIPEEGWFFRVPAARHLFAYAMSRLYAFRNSGNPILDNLAKSMAVSVWGKFQEMHGEIFGGIWNSIYACMVASRNRIAVCDFIYDNELVNDLISVTVDGCLATKLLAISAAKSFGQWRLNPPSPAMILTSMNQWAGDKRPNGKDVYEMIKEVKSHSAQQHFGGIHLATLEHDRYYKRLPRNGRDLLNNVYRSEAFTIPVGTEGKSP